MYRGFENSPCYDCYFFITLSKVTLSLYSSFFPLFHWERGERKPTTLEYTSHLVRPFSVCAVMVDPSFLWLHNCFQFLIPVSSTHGSNIFLNSSSLPGGYPVLSERFPSSTYPGLKF